MRKLVIGAAVLSLAMSGTVFAFNKSKCDSGVTKAEGKKAACKAGVIASAMGKGAAAPDPAKLQKCTDKFTKACTKATGAGDCDVQSPTGCTAAEAEVDACVAQFAASPSGAFLN